MIRRISEAEVVRRLSTHHATNLAASISYYALLALFPAVIALTAIAALVLDGDTARRDVVDFLFDELPVTEADGRGEIESAVDGVADNAGTIGIIGIGVLIFSASALMTAVRNALTIAFEVERQRPYLKGKALDVLLIFALGLLMAISVAGTFLINLLDDAKNDLGAFGDAIGGLLGFATGLIPIVMTAIVFAILLTLVPPHRGALRHLWPAVAVATLGFEIAKRGFSFYLDQFSNYSAVYGSLGAVIAFMVFVYIAALVLLVAAEYGAMRLERLDERPENGMDARPSTGA